MKKYFSQSFLLPLILVISGLNTLGSMFFFVQAQASCTLVAPESCYYVTKQPDPLGFAERYQHNGTPAHCVSHPSGNNDTISLEPAVCTYMKNKIASWPSSVSASVPPTAFDDCSQVRVRHIQKIIKTWHLNATHATQGNNQTSFIWPDPNWSLTKQDYADYYQHPTDSSKNFSVGQTLQTQFWYNTPTSRLSLNCDMNKTSMLNDGYYGYCTRMALQLYLNEDCVDYVPPVPRYVFGRTPGDQGLVDTTPGDPFPYGFTVSQDEDEQIRMCVNNEITPVLISFNADQTRDINSPRLTEICQNFLGLSLSDCTIPKIRQKVAYEHSKDLTAYLDPTPNATPNNAQQRLFKQDLSKLLIKNCTYNEWVIGRDNNGNDLFLEPPTNPGTTINLPGGETFDNYGYTPNGTISFCYEDTTKSDPTVRYTMYQATLFINPETEQISFEKGAGKYVCGQFGITNQADCTRSKLQTKLADMKVFFDGDPPPTDGNYRRADDYAVTFSALPEHKPNATPLADTDPSVVNNNRFKQELSQYLTANCRANPDAGNGKDKYSVTPCDANGNPEKTLTYWYDPQDRLLSSHLCTKLDSSFKNISQFIGEVKNSPLAQDPRYSSTISSITVPTPPTDFLLPNDSCRLEDFQRLVGFDNADGTVTKGDFYFYKGDKLDALRQIYRELHPTSTQRSTFLALEWLSANVFAESKLQVTDHPITLGQMDTGTIKVIENVAQSSCPDDCIDRTTNQVTPLPPYAHFMVPNPCPTQGSFHDCLGARLDRGETCRNDCSPGYIKNGQGICVSEDFFGWQSDYLRPKYQIGANWDDYEYKGDARDITYWGQRFGAKAINFLAITTVLFGMIAVLRMVLSGGESSQRENLKKVAQWSSIALIVAIFAYVIVKTVISMTYWG